MPLHALSIPPCARASQITLSELQGRLQGRARLHFLELTAIWQSPPRLWRSLLQITADKVAVGEGANDLRAVRSPALFLPESKPILVKESSCATIILARNGGLRITSQS